MDGDAHGQVFKTYVLRELTWMLSGSKDSAKVAFDIVFYGNDEEQEEKVEV